MEDPLKLYDIKFNELTYQIHFLPLPKTIYIHVHSIWQKTIKKKKTNKQI